MWKEVVAPIYKTVVGLQDTKDYMKVDENDENVLIESFIATAGRLAENFTRRRFLTQTHDLFLDSLVNRSGGSSAWWNGTREGTEDFAFGLARNYIEITRVPLQSVTFIKTFDTANVESTFAAESYFVDEVSTPARIVLNDGFSWPTGLRRYNAFQIRCIVGYGNAAAIPDDIQDAIKAQVHYMFLNRHVGNSQLSGIAEDLLLPNQVQAL